MAGTERCLRCYGGRCLRLGKPVARMVDYLAPERAPAHLRVRGLEEIPRFQFLSSGTLRFVSPLAQLNKILRPSAHSNHSSYSCRWHFASCGFSGAERKLSSNTLNMSDSEVTDAITWWSGVSTTFRIT